MAYRKPSAPSEVICIFGSREYPDWLEIKEVVDALPSTVVIVSGDCRGPDRVAAQFAEQRGLGVWHFPADWNGPDGRAAGFVRNSRMVEVSDRGIAFWYRRSAGTADTIRKFKAAGKPCEVHEWKP